MLGVDIDGYCVEISQRPQRQLLEDIAYHSAFFWAAHPIKGGHWMRGGLNRRGKGTIAAPSRCQGFDVQYFYSFGAPNYCNKFRDLDLRSVGGDAS